MNPNVKNVFTTSLLLTLLLAQFFAAPQRALAAPCDAATFIADVTVPDGTIFPPTTNFVKTWRIKNTGTCTWTTSYKLVFAGGTDLSGAEELALPAAVAPGGNIDLSLNLVSLAGDGRFRGYWQLKNASGARFGVGPNADQAFWVEIVVRGGVPSTAGYDFVANSGLAKWQSGAGALIFPGPTGDARGYGQQLSEVKLETGQTVSERALLMAPQNKTDGYIQALFPAQPIHSGDRFQATIGCQYGATTCYVTYRIDVRSSAGTKTLWAFKEKYEGLTYNVNLDLSSLAGKDVEFFLMVLATGSPNGDQAVWVAPRITRGVSTPPPVNTVAPTATTVAPRIATATIDMDQLVIGTCGTSNPVNVAAAVTVTTPTTVTYHWELVADKTIITPDQTLTFNSAGTQTVAPAGYGADCGTNYLARIIITSPNYYSAGIYYSVVSRTQTPPPLPSVTPIPVSDGYSLALNGGLARWQSGAGALTFPGADGDSRGFALKLDSVQAETGAVISEPSLLMVPQYKTDGYIQGLFPPQTIQSGDRFQATIGCQYGATSCYVTYRIDVRSSAGTKTLWTFRERYDGLTYNVNLDLSSLTGKNAEFFLLVLASGSPTGDRALWIAPRIVHAVSVPPTAVPTLTPPAIATQTVSVSATPSVTAIAPPTGTMTATATATIPTRPGWPVFSSTVYHYQFQYPPEGQVGGAGEGAAHISLPITSGTNLGEKYLDVSVTPNATACTSPFASGYAPGSFASAPVTINGIAFVKESASEAGAGNIYQWTAYSTLKDGNCISLGFVLHSTNPGNHATPPPVFDEAAESAVFGEIMSTFGFVP